MGFTENQIFDLVNQDPIKNVAPIGPLSPRQIESSFDHERNQQHDFFFEDKCMRGHSETFKRME